MRLELMGLAESRRWFVEQPGASPTGSEVLLQFRLVGNRLEEVARLGRPIFSELVDDTRRALVKPDAYSESERTETFRIRVSPEALRDRGLPMNAKADVAAREARTIMTMKGTVRVIYASAHEDITIQNPMQHQGQTINHARLKELGVEVRVLPPGNPASVPQSLGVISLQFLTKPESIRSVEFYDPWMKRMRSQPRTSQTNEGEPCTIYQLFDSHLGEDSQMVIQVFPRVEDVQLPFELKDVKLP